MNLINGKLLADKIKDRIAREVFELRSRTTARQPGLAIILVGSRPDSELYVNLKQKAAATVGIDTNLYKLSEQANETEILSAVNFLNNDPEINGILIQLPLPEHLDTDKIVNAIAPAKDVDGFTATSLAKLNSGHYRADRKPDPASGSDRWDTVISPVFQSILACLDEADCDCRNKTVAIVGKTGIFTQNLDLLVEGLGGRVALIAPESIDNGQATQADIIISAVGQAEFIRSEHIKNGAILIDVGIAKNASGQTRGDVDADSVADKAAWLTPVPGGIGPLTIAFALNNTLNFFKKTVTKPL